MNANTVVMKSSHGRLYSEIDAVPYNYVGLLLGTSPYMRDGSQNPIFASRLQSSAHLVLIDEVAEADGFEERLHVCVLSVYVEGG